MARGFCFAFYLGPQITAAHRAWPRCHPAQPAPPHLTQPFLKETHVIPGETSGICKKTKFKERNPPRALRPRKAAPSTLPRQPGRSRCSWEKQAAPSPALGHRAPRAAAPARQAGPAVSPQGSRHQPSDPVTAPVRNWDSGLWLRAPRPGSPSDWDLGVPTGKPRGCGVSGHGIKSPPVTNHAWRSAARAASCPPSLPPRGHSLVQRGVQSPSGPPRAWAAVASWTLPSWCPDFQTHSEQAVSPVASFVVALKTGTKPEPHTKPT